MQHAIHPTLKFIAVLVVGVALSGCGQQDSAPSTSTAASTPPPSSPAPATQAPTDTSQASPGATDNSQTAAAPPAAVTPIPHIDPIKSTPALAAEGKKFFFSAGCNACHGGTGGGGMCPPLTNPVWVYGSDDSTLHALIKEGSQAMQTTHGLKRVGHENVVGIMPAFGGVLKDEDINKILAFIHSINPTAGKGETPSAGGSR